MPARIKKKETNLEGRISMMRGREEVAYLLYRRDSLRVDALSTFVSPAMRGQGLAEQMANELLLLAKKKKLFIKPSCSYIEQLMETREEWRRYSEDYDASPEVMAHLYEVQNAENASVLSKFFQTQEGGYAQGDIFLGVRVPQIRNLIWSLAPWTFATICALVHRQEHEARALGFHLLVERMKKSLGDSSEMQRIYDLYMELLPYCNNWDLVDTSAPTLIGLYWKKRDPEQRRCALLAMAKSDSLWRQRIAIVGTHGLIRSGMADDALALAEELLPHKHHLIHKAVGWTLRELGWRVDERLLTDFLDMHASHMPRTMLRYSIERLSPEMRKHYMSIE